MNNKVTKPISSPGRSDKYPPPLMRFLRTNVGSKSSRRRSRSRATPLFFIRKKNTFIETTTTTQEPSSPKVTCIGKVVVRRSNKNKNKKPTATAAAATSKSHHRRLCRCLRNIKPTSFRCFRGVLGKWVSFFRCGCCKKSGDLHVSPAVSIKDQYQDQDQEREEESVRVREVDDTRNCDRGLISLSPKNRILLTRCRSGSYTTSSSLGSMLIREVARMEVKKEKEEVNVEGKMEVLMIKREEVGDDDDDEGSGEFKAVKLVSPLILSRCKSEPARTWDRILV